MTSKWTLRITRRTDGVIEESKHLSTYTMNCIIEGIRRYEGTLRNKIEVELEEKSDARTAR